jgi:hypothetical protein
MEVCLPAQRVPIHADRRRCTWMYETKNETAPSRRSAQADRPIDFVLSCVAHLGWAC